MIGNEMEEAILVIYAITVLTMGGVGIIYLIALGIAKLKGKRPYNGRFRTGGVL